MCGRYVMARAVGDLVAATGAEYPEDFELRESYNVAPTTDVPILLERVIEGEIRRQLHIARWGLVPVWAKDPSVGSRAFNARVETVAEKPTFRAALGARRCAVPADGYYEWKKQGPRTKRPYYVHPADGSPILFAGLYEWWKDPSKEEGDPERWLLSTTVITTAAPPADSGSEVLRELASLHDRMPAPMDRDTLEAWLDPAAKDGAALAEQVRDRAWDAASGWVLDPVGAAVGNVRNNSPELITPQPDLLDS
ncbi:SOS response-associated peptidase [Arthrobacter mobilis]|uniref:Abasic site processing protein n=1 Tax=Arthrobacter mobilis TaxID=2724944 RepID=A0A7X6HBM8_9MICC|nr:SOS response-associated peptidase [Arthrobacter mobilis]NKX54102.1 SOS response-associated peptidase [Arthrobacter mobilis]